MGHGLVFWGLQRVTVSKYRIFSELHMICKGKRNSIKSIRLRAMVQDVGTHMRRLKWCWAEHVMREREREREESGLGTLQSGTQEKAKVGKDSKGKGEKTT